MGKHREMIGGTPDDYRLASILIDVFTRIRSGSPSNLRLDELARFAKYGSVLLPRHMEPRQQLELWYEMYRKVGVTYEEIELSDGASSPIDLPMFSLPVPEEIRGWQAAYKFAEEVMPAKPWKWTSESLDNHRYDKQPSCCAPLDRSVWTCGDLNADREWKNHSANMLWNGHAENLFLGLTRTILEHCMTAFATNNRMFMDMRTVTLCAGSLCSDGLVPRVFVVGGGLRVGRDHPDDAVGDLRARQAVS